MDRRKELIAQYKQTKIPMGVYQIKNNVNNKIYIDSSPNLKAKFNRLVAELNEGKFRINSQLQEEWKRYGEQNFTIEVLEYLEPMDDPDYNCTKDLKELKAICLEKLQPFEEKGYNKR